MSTKYLPENRHLTLYIVCRDDDPGIEDCFGDLYSLVPEGLVIGWQQDKNGLWCPLIPGEADWSQYRSEGYCFVSENRTGTFKGRDHVQLMQYDGTPHAWLSIEDCYRWLQKKRKRRA